VTRLARLAPVLICVITVLAFLPALNGEFLNWDDSTLFTTNLDYRGLGPSQLRWMFTTALAGHYMPLTWLTLGLNYTLGGTNPWGYHLAALLLRAGNAVLFYLVAYRLLSDVGSGRGDGTIHSPAIRAGSQRFSDGPIPEPPTVLPSVDAPAEIAIMFALVPTPSLRLRRKSR